MEPRMYDVGKKMGKNELGTGKEGGQSVYYPRITISASDIPQLEDYDVGDTCRAMILKKIIEKRLDDDGNETYTFEIRKLGIVGKGPVDKKEYSKMSEEEKDKVDEEEVLGS